jgi:sugar phosphate isomerase/epimerase
MGARDLLDEAQRLGVRVVQVADNLPLDALGASELRALAARARDRGIAIEVGTRGIAPDVLRRYLEIAGLFGSPVLRTVIDTATHRPGEDEIVTTLAPLLPEFVGRGITLAVENHDRFRARELVHLLNRLASPGVGVCLDTANSLGALEGPEVVFPALAPFVTNLHIKDMAIERTNHGLGFVVEGRPAGQGVIDIPGLLALLHAHGRDCNAIVELWPPAMPVLADTIARERLWVEQSVAYMRTLLPD